MNTTKAAVWATTGIIGAGVAGGITYAAVSAPAAATAGATVGQSTPAAGQMQGRMGMRRAALLRHLEHGQLTLRVRDGDRTVDLQRGTVTDASPTSIAVTSTDKYHATYTVDASTKVRTRAGLVGISAVHEGDQVFVVATAGKAVRIVDRGTASGG
jgi:hypothetical protein